ncbi:MAG: gamma-glutamylcyclotransferase [Chloroflexi bacterium]|nr:gamma-glutamylcyclotransferase [Chloroflexota bacterium]
MSGETDTEEKYPFFFYGTLRRGQPNYALLRSNTSIEEPALAPQMELYSLGNFPMMVPGDHTVRGELVTLEHRIYDQLKERIDYLEGFRPFVAGECLYQRNLIQVVREADGERVWAWAYVGTRDFVLGRYPQVPGEDWTAHQMNIMMNTRFARFVSDAGQAITARG